MWDDGNDLSQIEWKRELSEAIAESAYARMLVAQALMECIEDEDLRGFYHSEHEYDCKQWVRWLCRDGRPCDIIERVLPRDMGLITDSCQYGTSRIYFIRRQHVKNTDGNGNNGGNGGGL